MSITKFNKKAVKFDFEPGKDFEYKSLKTLYSEYGKGVIYKVNALYINTSGMYGEQPLIVTDKEYVNLPTHLLETVKEIRDDEDMVNDINNGKVGFEIYEYDSNKNNRKGYSINWVEL